jgi:hypothetical protein
VDQLNGAAGRLSCDHDRGRSHAWGGGKAGLRRDQLGPLRGRTGCCSSTRVSGRRAVQNSWIPLKNSGDGGGGALPGPCAVRELHDSIGNPAPSRRGVVLVCSRGLANSVLAPLRGISCGGIATTVVALPRSLGLLSQPARPHDGSPSRRGVGAGRTLLRPAGGTFYSRGL